MTNSAMPVSTVRALVALAVSAARASTLIWKISLALSLVVSAEVHAGEAGRNAVPISGIA